MERFGKDKGSTELLDANHNLSTRRYWNYAATKGKHTWDITTISWHSQQWKKRLCPYSEQLILVTSKRDLKLQDKGDLAMVMGMVYCKNMERNYLPSYGDIEDEKIG